MRSLTVASLLLVVGLCRAQQLAGYVQFEGNRSSPKSVSRQARDALEQADNSPDASHSVSFSSPGYGDWNWTLQLSDVSVPTLSNSTPDAHVAFTTWHFSRVGEQPSRAYRPEEPPFCAYPMDVNFPYNVSSQWDQNNSSCVPALGEECASALARVTMSSDCDSKNVDILQVIGENACAGMLSGGPAESHGIGKYGYAFDDRNVSDSDEAWGYAITSPYEGGNETAFQVEAERLRIMLFSGREGSELVCNRVAQTVEIGAEEESEEGNGQGDGDESADESGASSYSSHVGGLAISGLVCCMAAYWL